MTLREASAIGRSVRSRSARGLPFLVPGTIRRRLVRWQPTRNVALRHVLRIGVVGGAYWRERRVKDHEDKRTVRQ